MLQCWMVYQSPELFPLLLSDFSPLTPLISIVVCMGPIADLTGRYEGRGAEQDIHS